MSANEELQQARALIQTKRYAEARQVLKKINHPTATKWLARLDEIAPEKPVQPKRSAPPAPTRKAQTQPERRRRGGCLRSLLLLALILVVGGLGVFAVPYLNNQRMLDERAMTYTLLPIYNYTVIAYAEQTSTSAAQTWSAVPNIIATANALPPTVEGVITTPLPTVPPFPSPDVPQPSAPAPTAQASGDNQLVIENAALGRIMINAPEGWQSDGAAINRDSFLTSGVVVSTLSAPTRLIPLEQIVNGRRDSAGVVTITETTAGERQVFIIEEVDSADQIIISYYVKDSDDDVVVFMVQSSVEDKAALHDDILLMVSSVEAE